MNHSWGEHAPRKQEPLLFLESVIIMTVATQAEALFVSSLQPSDHPSANEVVAAIRVSLKTQGGVSGCAGAFATEYGEHPESSADRMRWALAQVAASALASAA
jgi:uncharacterized membrane protein